MWRRPFLFTSFIIQIHIEIIKKTGASEMQSDVAFLSARGLFLKK